MYVPAASQSQSTPCGHLPGAVRRQMRVEYKRRRPCRFGGHGLTDPVRLERPGLSPTWRCSRRNTPRGRSEKKWSGEKIRTCDHRHPYRCATKLRHPERLYLPACPVARNDLRLFASAECGCGNPPTVKAAGSTPAAWVDVSEVPGSTGSIRTGLRIRQPSRSFAKSAKPVRNLHHL